MLISLDFSIGNQKLISYYLISDFSCLKSNINDHCQKYNKFALIGIKGT